MSFNFYKYNKTLKKEITITTTKMMDTILTTFWFIIIHLNNNYKINSYRAEKIKEKESKNIIIEKS